ncbi:efflux RND transporter permease subunit [Sinimarinibacterium sp. CAU 1509]|uniref:efflux RND transporter permease subunit n=1 Tax=Sinimarinibacterium sp. CAU 1509 TaxID=2562283 RepID=UPI0010AB7F41|nr:efflux RND transporter permease subunit [Sinimarinibacterium sp. CAU 1509]TJY59289.1 efflux RND transporter permease subunit [Sinimarinibacterium sp. CAU 1509]
MRISEFAVRNVPFMIVVFLLMIAVGVSSWLNIPRTEDPHFPISAFQIVAVYPGADPIEIERQIVEPIEDAMNTLDDVKDMTSTSDDSLGIVRIEFEGDVDVDKKYDEVTRELAAIERSFPDGLADLKVHKINPGNVNIVQIALVSDSASWRTLEDTAEDLKDRIERIPGIRETETWAYPQRELRVELNLSRMAELNLRTPQVLQSIAGRNTNVPGGAVELGARRFNLKTTGSYRSIDEVLDTVIGGTGDALVRVRDVARVEWDHGPLDYTARLDGHRAVWVTANQKTGENIFVTIAAIQQVIGAFKPSLPADVKLVQAFDQSKNVAKRLDRLSADFLIAIVLVSITLLPLGLRAAGIVMVSIPLSLMSGLAALYFTGFSLNQLSIAGFVVALGLLVDDSIVVTENIARHLRLGYGRDQAAILATRQISLAVLGCTATLLFAFLPLLELPGNAGKFIRSLPASVVFTVAASLFVALTIIPFLASRILPREEAAEGNRFLRGLMHLIHTIYSPLLQRALARPKTTVLLSTLAVVASFSLIPIIGVGMFPKADTAQFMIRVTLPNGSSIDATDTILRETEAVLSTHPEVEHVMSNLGRGNPQIYYNVFQKEYAANVADLFVQLKSFQGDATRKLLDRIRSELDTIPGAEIVLKEFENGPPLEAPIAIRIIGPDLGVLRHLAGEVEQLMQATPGTRDVSNPQRRSRIDLALNVDTTKAGLLGVSPLELDQTVRLAVAGLDAGEFRETDGDSYPIVLRAPLSGRASLDALQGLHVGTAGGAQVPLDQLTRVQLTESPTMIYRRDRERAVLLTAYTETGYNTERVTNRVLEQLATLDWPDGYRYVAAGEVESRQDSFAGFGTAILVAVFGILAVLVLEFGSFKSTLIVATVVPLGVMGGILMLMATGGVLSFTAMIGFIALTGIEIKNSILLVDFTNQLRQQGKPLDEAIAEAGEIRFLPILLTSVTAIGGLMPLALQQSALYSPMAWVIIGGLITSTLIGRLVTPVMYKLVPPTLKATEPPIDP